MDKKSRAKAWCFDKGVSEAQIQAAWDNAKDKSPLAKNLHKNGFTWWWLPPHLLEQLIKRYSDPATASLT